MKNYGSSVTGHDGSVTARRQLCNRARWFCNSENEELRQLCNRARLQSCRKCCKTARALAPALRFSPAKEYRENSITLLKENNGGSRGLQAPDEAGVQTGFSPGLSNPALIASNKLPPPRSTDGSTPADTRKGHHNKAVHKVRAGRDSAHPGRVPQPAAPLLPG